MKTSRIINIAMLAAVLFAGCGKSGSDRLRLFVEPMCFGGAKVHFDPAHINDATWVENELINLCGTSYPIVNSNGHAYLVTGGAELPSTLYAIYPATVNDGLGNDIEVVNGGAGACGVGIRSLAVNLHADGKSDVIFPMAATATGGSQSLLFNHLTGGLKLTIANNRDQDVTVNRLVVSATQGSGTPAIYRDLAPEWAGSTQPLLPTFPARHGATGDQDMGAGFISDMTLMMNTEGTPGVTIPRKTNGTPGRITFCIPMLAKDLRYIQIIGYNGVSPVFQTPKKDIGTPKDVERNNMYNIPTIDIL